jgi:predicted AAA+ superfamily ATPase
LNPWWEGKEIETGISRDAYLGKIPTYLTRRQIEVYIGSRRTGKTTLLKQFIKTLLQTEGLIEADRRFHRIADQFQ